MKPRISFFCPAYYDEENLPVLIPDVVEYLESATSDYEVIIVEDGSPDRTAEVADKLAGDFDKVRVVHHEKNKGYGAALKRGFKEANRFELVMYTDGDAQFDIRELDLLLPLIENADIVLGFRKNREDTVGRRVQSKVFNSICRVFFKVRVADVNAAFKLFKREVIDSMTITSESVAINVEMLAKAAKNGFAISEVGVTHYPRISGPASGGKPSVIISTIVELSSCHRELSDIPMPRKKA